MLVPRIVNAADVTRIVIERSDNSQPEHRRIQPRVVGGTLAAVHHSRHCQRDIQHVLYIVVFGIAGVVAVAVPAVEARRIPKSGLQYCTRLLFIQGRVHAINFSGHLFVIGGVYFVANIKFAAAMIWHTVMRTHPAAG